MGDVSRRTLTVGEVVIREQRRYCAQHGLPLFLPYDGRCFSCRRDITHHSRIRSVARRSLITGCPYCSRSFCE